jgi:hypothetical protein
MLRPDIVGAAGGRGEGFVEKAWVDHSSPSAINFACRLHGRRKGRVPDRQEDSSIARMRDKLIHDYFGINLELVWDVVETHLSPLQSKINQLLGDMSEPG